MILRYKKWIGRCNAYDDQVKKLPDDPVVWRKASVQWQIGLTILSQGPEGLGQKCCQHGMIGTTEEIIGVAWYDYTACQRIERFMGKTLQRWMIKLCIGRRHWMHDTSKIRRFTKRPTVILKKGWYPSTRWSDSHLCNVSIHLLQLHFYFLLKGQLFWVIGLFIPPLAHLKVLESRGSSYTLQKDIQATISA